MLENNKKVYDAFGGNPYSMIRCEFYMEDKLVYEFECKVWEAIDKATKFINENDNVVMYFFKRSKLSLINL